jgi:thiol-disulfide isomerase/thioredoxin
MLPEALRKTIQITILGVLLYALFFFVNQNRTPPFKNRVGEFLKEPLEITWLNEKTQNKSLPTLLIRWEPWCPSCIRSIPQNNELYEKYKGQLNIAGLTMQWDDGTRELSRNLISYPVGQEQSGILDQYFEVQAIPFYVLLNAKKQVLYQGNKISEATLKRFFTLFPNS